MTNIPDVANVDSLVMRAILDGFDYLAGVESEAGISYNYAHNRGMVSMAYQIRVITIDQYVALIAELEKIKKIALDKIK